MHHKRRYKNHVSLSTYLYGENTTYTEKQTAKKLIQANAINFGWGIDEIYFYQNILEMVDVIA